MYACILNIFYICVNFSQIGLPSCMREVDDSKSILSPLDIINLTPGGNRGHSFNEAMSKSTRKYTERNSE